MQFRNILFFAGLAAAAVIDAGNAAAGAVKARAEDAVHQGTCTDRHDTHAPHGVCTSGTGNSSWKGNCDAAHACTAVGNHCSISTASGGHVVCS